MSLSVSVCLPVCLPVCLHVCLSVSLPVSFSLALPPVSLHVAHCVSVYLSAHDYDEGKHLNCNFVPITCSTTCLCNLEMERMWYDFIFYCGATHGGEQWEKGLLYCIVYSAHGGVMLYRWTTVCSQTSGAASSLSPRDTITRVCCRQLQVKQQRSHTCRAHRRALATVVKYCIENGCIWNT